MRTLGHLAADAAGAMAVETALVAPILLMLSVGSFQISELVSRQHEIQSAASEAEQIALANKPDTQAKLDLIETILSASTGVPAANIELTFRYRCGTTATMSSTNGGCGADAEWTYVHIEVEETYTPTWADFGVGSPIDLGVERTVQVS